MQAKKTHLVIKQAERFFRAHKNRDKKLLKIAPLRSKQGVFLEKNAFKTRSLGHVDLYMTSVNGSTC